jgi:hypothetical protein
MPPRMGDATDDTNVPLFDAPALSRVLPERTACRQSGRRGRWKSWALHAHPYLADRAPVCNRKRGHEGPHRTYDANARIHAEWE